MTADFFQKPATGRLDNHAFFYLIRCRNRHAVDKCIKTFIYSLVSESTHISLLFLSFQSIPKHLIQMYVFIFNYFVTFFLCQIYSITWLRWIKPITVYNYWKRKIFSSQ